MILVATVFLVVVILVMMIAILGLALYYFTLHDMHATFVPENAVKFVNAGGTSKKSSGKYVRTLPNAKKLKWTKDGFVPKAHYRDVDDTEADWFSRKLRKWFGIYWVSLFFPLRRLHRFKIVKESLKGERSPNKPLRDMIVRHGTEEVDHLRVYFPRPFVFEGVEPLDMFSLDILVVAEFEVVDPYPAAYIYGERLFDYLKSSLEGTVIDIVAKLLFRDFLKLPKGKGSQFTKELKKGLNSDLPGYIENMGIKLTDAWIGEWTIADDDEGSLVKAVRAKRTAIELGQADLEAAKLEKKAAEQRAIGAAAPTKELVAAYKKGRSVGPLVSAERVAGLLAGEKSSLTTLVMGHGGVIPTLPIGTMPSGVPGKTTETGGPKPPKDTRAGRKRGKQGETGLETPPAST